MKISINHQELEFDDSLTIADILRRQNFPKEGIAVAVNNKVVTRAQWQERVIIDGDNLTVITAVCGG